MKDKEPKKFYFTTGFGEHEGHFQAPIPPIPPTPPMPPMAAMFPHGNKDIKFEFKTGHDKIYQEVDDDVLQIFVVMPGIDKSSLKVRSKPDKINISADLKTQYQDKLGSNTQNYVFHLIEEVLPDQASAKYQDGILSIRIPVATPPTNVNIETNEE